MPTDSEIAWLAGLLEGEGSFGMITSHVGGKRYRYPKIVVNMTDLDVIEHVATIFGTKVYVMPVYLRQGYASPKQQWRAQISGAKAAEWMRELRPWLGVRRRARIDEVLQEYEAREPTEVRRRQSCQQVAASRDRDKTTGRFLVS